MISTTPESWNTTRRPDLNMWCEKESQRIGKMLRKSIQCTTAESSPTLGKDVDIHILTAFRTQVDVAVL